MQELKRYRRSLLGKIKRTDDAIIHHAAMTAYCKSASVRLRGELRQIDADIALRTPVTHPQASEAGE